MTDETQNPMQTEQLRLIVRDETNKLLLEHLQLCPFVSNKIEERTRKLETSLAKLFGFMFGSGMLGGITGAGIGKLIN